MTEQRGNLTLDALEFLVAPHEKFNVRKELLERHPKGTLDDGTKVTMNFVLNSIKSRT